MVLPPPLPCTSPPCAHPHNNTIHYYDTAPVTPPHPRGPPPVHHPPPLPPHLVASLMSRAAMASSTALACRFSVALAASTSSSSLVRRMTATASPFSRSILRARPRQCVRLGGRGASRAASKCVHVHVWCARTDAHAAGRARRVPRADKQCAPACMLLSNTTWQHALPQKAHLVLSSFCRTYSDFQSLVSCSMPLCKTGGRGEEGVTGHTHARFQTGSSSRQRFEAYWSGFHSLLVWKCAMPCQPKQALRACAARR